MGKESHYKEYLAGTIINLICAAGGMSVAWVAPVLQKLIKGEDTPLSYPLINKSSEVAWIGSTQALAGCLSPFFTGLMTDRIGRKWSLQFSSILFMSSYILLLFGHEIWIIYISRAFQGFSKGICFTVVPMYIGEFASDSCRGALGSFVQFFFVIGILLSYAIGSYVTYNTFNLICLSIPVMFSITIILIPESPFYYSTKGDKKNAIKSLKWFRNENDVDMLIDEFKIIEKYAASGNRFQKENLLDIFRDKGNLRAFIICAGLIIAQQFSGITCILLYCTVIFEASGVNFDAAISSIIIGLIQVVACGLALYIVYRFGRRIPLIVSLVGSCLSLIALGYYFNVKDTGINGLDWLPTTSMVVYMMFYCIGLGPVPWALVSEMFQGNIKSTATSMVIFCVWICGFLTAQLFPRINELGPQYPFYIFGACCAGYVFFVIFVVIETKGLNIQEIQDKLRKS